MVLQSRVQQVKGTFPYISACHFLSTLYVLSIALSKLVHLHHYHSFVDFGFIEALYLPTLCFADLAAYLVIRICLARHPRDFFRLDNVQPWLITPLSSHNSKGERIEKRSSHHPEVSRTWLETALFASGAVNCVVTAYFALADAYIYIDFGGLCSWPQVLEVTTTPASAAIFVSQWISASELRALVLIPIATGLVTGLLCILPIGRMMRRLTRFNPLKGTLAALAMHLCLYLLSVPRPYRSIPFLLASCSLWIHIFASAKASMLSMTNEESAKSLDAKQKQRSSNRAYGLFVTNIVVLALCFRPSDLSDLAFTVPTSVGLSLSQITPEFCPVGKDIASVPSQRRSDLLGCHSHDCTFGDRSFEHLQVLSHAWGEAPPPGFHMLSEDQQRGWKRWNTSEGTSAAPSGYNYLYDQDKVSNLDRPIYEQLLRDEHTGMPLLPELKLRNVFFLILESTRADTFPLALDGVIARRAMNDRKPDKKYLSLEDVTPTARRYLGARSQSDDRPQTGGIVVEGAETASTYSLKSFVASHCGITPLPVDFMRETEPEAQFYQPCLPHILHALDRKSYADSTLRSPHASGNESWSLLYAQSISARFDRQPELMAKFGFHEAEVFVKKDMDRPDAPHPVPAVVRAASTGSYFYPEKHLGPYFRDFFRDAKQNEKRFFLSHITATAHYPWDLPIDWMVRSYCEDVHLNKMLNALAYQDEWLAELVQAMEDEGVLDETLLIVSSDHASSWKEGDLGLSLPFHNPHIKNFQIPLGIHNPKLPAMRIAANATNLSILPTVLDLFIHSDSGSSKEGRDFLKALLPMYEGQSLIRPMNYEAPPAGNRRKPLNYGLLNPGRGHITVFSPEPGVHWRLTMPLCHPGTFTAANLLEDPNEDNPVRSVSLDRVVAEARKRWDADAAQWFADAGPRAAEWVREVSRRWDVDQSSLPGSMVRFWTAE